MNLLHEVTIIYHYSPFLQYFPTPLHPTFSFLMFFIYTKKSLQNVTISEAFNCLKLKTKYFYENYSSIFKFMPPRTNVNQNLQISKFIPNKYSLTRFLLHSFGL